MKAFVLASIILSVSCNQTSKENSEKTSIISIIDTLEKYKTKDSFITSFHNQHNLDDFLHTGKLNNEQFALHSILETGELVIYTAENDKWLQADTLKGYASNYKGFRRTDLNKDGFDDLEFFNFQDSVGLQLFYYPKQPQLRLNVKKNSSD